MTSLEDQRKISKVIEETLAKQTSLQDLAHSRRLTEIFLQLREVCWSNIVDCDSSLTNITLGYTGTENPDGEQFQLKVSLPNDFPSEAPLCNDDFPSSLTLKKYIWIPNKTKLSHIYATFIERVNSLAPIHRCLRELDERTRVLDLPVASLNILYRRISLQDGVSLHVAIDDQNDTSELPQVQILGPDHKVKQLKANLADKADTFDPSSSLVDNLQRILGIQFPGPCQAGDEEPESSGECGICYNYHLNGSPPTRNCDCGCAFHIDCIYEWLRSTLENRQSLNTIFGKCPYCEKPISCPMPS